jgi:hypothetical protein
MSFVQYLKSFSRPGGNKLDVHDFMRFGILGGTLRT